MSPGMQEKLEECAPVVWTPKQVGSDATVSSTEPAEARPLMSLELALELALKLALKLALELALELVLELVLELALELAREALSRQVRSDARVKSEESARVDVILVPVLITKE